MSDLISREKAYEVLTDYYHQRTEMQHKALKEALDMVPSAEPTSEMCWRCNCPKMASAELKSCGYWDAESKYCALNRPSAEPKLTTNLQLTCNQLATDCISRQAAIDALHAQFKDGFDGDKWWNSTHVLAAIEALPSAEPRWIPVEDEPPKEKKHYWVCTDTGYQCECRWTNNVYGLRDSDEWGWSIFDIPQYSKVVAYMSLPEPWKGGAE